MPAVAGQFFLAESGQPWTLFAGLLLFAAAAAFLYPLAGAPKQPAPLSFRWELFLFLLILSAAFGFRVCGIDSLPPGMHTDQGLTGLCALRILHEGWRPFGEVFDYQVPELFLFYQLAAWFGLVGSSYFTFHLFFILLSLAAFPLVYWTFRQWAGPRVALFSLFILAAIRWNWVETRNGYPSIQVPFYLFGALAFWSYWRTSGKKWSFYVSAVFVGAGFYTYQAFKIVPLLMGVYALYEHLQEKIHRQDAKTPRKTLFSKTKKSIKQSTSPKYSVQLFLLYFLIVFILILPLLTVMAQKGILGHRESDLFIGAKIVQEHSLKPLWDVWTGTLLMFNRAGDMNPRHNIPGRPMLDDITAVLFVLGLVLAWRRRKEPAGFYPLAGFGVMLLTGLLASDPAHSNRLVSLTPFVAYFAGCALVFFQEKAKSVFTKRELPVLVAVLLACIAGQNAWAYFVDQAGNDECREAFGRVQSFIGRNIADSWKSSPDQNRYFIAPSLFKNLTVNYLAYPARSSLYEFNLQDWAAGKVPMDKPILLYLEPEQSGVVEFVQTLFPDSAMVKYPAPRGHTEMAYCWIYSHKPSRFKPWRRGLKGGYLNASSWNSKPVTTQWDPVLNFTSKFDFPFTQPPPFRIRWTGELDIPKAGEYQFQVLTTDSAQLWLDGKSVVPEKSVRLAAGAHSLRLEFEKDAGDSLALNFIWKKPGEDKWEVVPATIFGKINR